MSVDLFPGDCLAVLREIPDGSVQCCVTSPPYYGLRDYGTAKWEGGDAECDHQYKKGGRNPETAAKQLTNAGTLSSQYEHTCGKCGAIRIDNQIGLEQTPEEYIARLVAVFREVRRVLTDDGTCWINLGDSYFSDTKGAGGPTPKQVSNAGSFYEPRHFERNGLKPKDLLMIPARVALALQADGWYLRSEIIWHKPNPMPESVRDRPTKSHEMIYLLAKNQRYFYDAEAVREPQVCDKKTFYAKLIKQPHKGQRDPGGKRDTTGGFQKATFNPAGRNRRDVWTVTTKPYKEAHFAVFPPRPHRAVHPGRNIRARRMSQVRARVGAGGGSRRRTAEDTRRGCVCG